MVVVIVTPVNGSTSYSSVRELVAKIDAELGKEMIEGCELPNCLEFVVGDLINAHLVIKDVRKCLKRVSYVSDGALYQLPAKLKPTPENLAKVKQTSWWKDSDVMLNDMHLDDAVKVYQIGRAHV